MKDSSRLFFIELRVVVKPDPEMLLVLI